MLKRHAGLLTEGLSLWSSRMVSAATSPSLTSRAVNGKSSLTDAYFNAFQISDILFLIFISSALLGLVTPLFLYEREKNTEKGYQLFGNFFFVLNTAFLGVIITAWFFLPKILEISFPSVFEKTPIELITMGRIFLISNFIFGFNVWN